MTIASEINKSGPYYGNGVTTTFPFDFKIDNAAHIRVVAMTGVAQADLVLSTDYIVTGVGDSDGGSVILTAPPTIATSITLVRNVPFTQELDLQNQGAFSAESVERSFDLSVARDQQLQEHISRVVTLPVGFEMTGEEFFAQQIAAAASEADRSEAAAVDAERSAATASVTSFATRAAALVYSPSVAPNFLRLEGYAAAGDGGGALYKRVNAEPTHTGKFSITAGGSAVWYELASVPINVKMFGAVGDGVANDAPPFNAAIAYLKARGGGELFIPKPTVPYLWNSTVVHDATVPIVFSGEGRKVSTIKAGSGVTTAMRIGTAGSYQSSPQLLRNFGFAAPTEINCVHVEVHETVLDVDSIETSLGRHAFLLDNVYSYNIRNCHFGATRNQAIMADTPADAHNSLLLSNGFFGCGVDATVPAIQLRGSDNVSIWQNQFEYCHSSFILYGCTCVSILDNYMEYGTNPFYFALNGTDRNRSIRVEGNWIALFTNAAYLEHLDGADFEHNHIYNQNISFGPEANSRDLNWGRNIIFGSSVIGTVPWNIPTLLNGWSDGATPLRYKKLPDGTVVLRGSVTRASGSGNQVVTTLPVGYRPSQTATLLMITSTGTTLANVSSGGNVYVEPGVSFTGIVHLDAMRFVANS